MKWVDFAVNKKLGYLCGIVNIIQKTNGGKFMKKVLLILLCVVMLGLAGCTSGGNENRVTLNNGFTQNDNKSGLSENDLMNSRVVQEYFSKRNLSVKSLVINNTFTEDRQSTAYVHIVAENDTARLSINYEIKSTKYDNGSWEVTNIYAEEKELYLPVSDPDIDIYYDDSEVVINRTDSEDRGDSILCRVYYKRIYDGKAARIEEDFSRNYYFNKETGEGWIYYDGLRDECLGGSYELKSVTTTVEKKGEGKAKVYIEFSMNGDSISVHNLQATAQGKKFTLLNNYDYSNMKFTSEYYKGVNGRLASSPCENDYMCEFRVYYKNSLGRDDDTSATFFVTPDELWLEIYVPSQGYGKYELMN